MLSKMFVEFLGNKLDLHDELEAIKGMHLTGQASVPIKSQILLPGYSQDDMR